MVLFLKVRQMVGDSGGCDAKKLGEGLGTHTWGGDMNLVGILAAESIVINYLIGYR